MLLLRQIEGGHAGVRQRRCNLFVTRFAQQKGKQGRSVCNDGIAVN